MSLIVRKGPGNFVAATMPAQMQNQSLVALVGPYVSKVKATWRGFFARKLFDRPKCDELKVEKLRMWCVVAASFAP